jgi:hypothetical protein
MKNLGAHRVFLAFCCWVAIAFTGALLPACLGSGDDAFLPAKPSDAGDAGDGHADGPTDAPSEMHAEAAMDVVVVVVQDAGDATVQDSGGMVMDGGPPAAELAAYPIDFGQVGCGASGTQTLSIKNVGFGKLAISATTTGLAFSVSPSNLSLAHGATGTLNLTAKIPTTASPGANVAGALNLFTNDPNNANVSIHLLATPTGAALAVAPTTLTFPVTQTGTSAANEVFFILNRGNAPISFTLGTPSDGEFTLTPAPSGPLMLNGGDIWPVAVSFTPTGTSASGKSTLTVNQGTVLCGNSATEVDFTGQGTLANVTGWPTLPNASPGIDFPDAGCGDPTAPAPYTFVLQNKGTGPATLTAVSISPASAGFTTNVVAPSPIPADGGTLSVTVTPPRFQAQNVDGGAAAGTMPAAVTAVLNMTVDSTDMHSLALSEEPSGASLNFQTTSGFGNFPNPVVLLATPTSDQTQTFNVINAGTTTANVNVFVVGPNGGDAGAAADAEADATAVAGAPLPFRVDVNNPLQVPTIASGTQSVQDSITFLPVVAGGNVAQLAMSVDSSTLLCAQLPSPLTLTGTGIGGGPNISPSTLTFYPQCDGTSTPAAQVLTVNNDGTRDLNWSMSSVTGPGAGQYMLTAPTQPSNNAQPGLLRPGESSTISISVAGLPLYAKSSSAAPAPATLAAQLTITTDVPYDSPHVVSLNEVPIGDQLSVSVGSLGFGQFPINQSTLPLSFTITNNGNSGPNADSAGVVLTPSNSAYSVSPSPVNLPPGGGTAGSSTENVVFTPTSNGMVSAEIDISRSSANAPLCAPLPGPIQLTGTGTQGLPVISPATFDFGLVNCGSSGQPQVFTVINQGNQPFNVMSVTLGKSPSPFTLSGVPTSPIVGNGNATFTVTPNPIPATGVDPMDKNAYSDTMTVTTDAVNDSPHTIPLAMQPQGAVIVINPAISTTWNFGTVGFGTVGTITSVITNNGNATTTVALTGVSQPSIFNLANSPTTVAANGATSLVGQFAPPSANGSWTDQGTLVMTASQAFCSAPPSGWQAGSTPTTWTGPAVALSGSSNSTPPVTSSGSFAFPATDCGSGPPAAQTITLTNGTNQSYPFTASLNAGKHYTISVGADGGTSGTLPANGVASIVVTPMAVTPGPGVLAGSAPYADDVLVTVGNPSVWSATFPVSWTLNGAVLNLPHGAGDHTNAGATFYVADSNSGHTLPIDNTGTAAASVNLALTPLGGLSISPTPPISVVPGIRSLPVLNSTLTADICPNQTSSNPTFSYSGAVCQPLQFSSINVRSCIGAFP